jgi:hypothetical protein
MSPSRFCKSGSDKQFIGNWDFRISSTTNFVPGIICVFGRTAFPKFKSSNQDPDRLQEAFHKNVRVTGSFLNIFLGLRRLSGSFSRECHFEVACYLDLLNYTKGD